MLEGIRILDFTQYLPGPHATLRLADMGADVIKIEAPFGDLARFSLDEHAQSPVFLAQNRKKKSVVLNLKNEEDRKAALELAREADVVIEGFRPGVAARIGIGYEEIKSVKPDIIYCSLTGYGQTGSISHLGGHDINYMSLSGMLAQTKDQNGKPRLPSNTLADFIGGISASEAILAALVKRMRTNEGSYIDLAITKTLLPLMSNHILIESLTGEEHGVERLSGAFVCYTLYETSDQRFIAIGALEEKFWHNFCRGVGKEEWQKEQFSRAESGNPIYEEIQALIRTKSLSEWSRFAREVDCCMSPVLETSELIEAEELREWNLISDSGSYRYVTNQATGFSGLTPDTEPPALGEHTKEYVGKLSR